MACKMTHVAGQNDFTLDVQAVRNLKPAAHDRLADFEQLGARRIVKRASQHELLGDVGYAFADNVRCAALPRAVSRIAGLSLVTSTYHAMRGGALAAMEAARALKVPQPTIGKIVSGNIDKLSIEFLVRLMVRADLPLGLSGGVVVSARRRARHAAAMA
jgi:predicted XRE-type DNA-binding protein